MKFYIVLSNFAEWGPSHGAITNGSAQRENNVDKYLTVPLKPRDERRRLFESDSAIDEAPDVRSWKEEERSEASDQEKEEEKEEPKGVQEVGIPCWYVIILRLHFEIHDRVWAFTTAMSVMKSRALKGNAGRGG